MADYLTIDAKTVAVQIDDLLASYPELAEDEALRADMIEGETSFLALMSRALDHEREAKSMVEAMKIRSDDLSERRRRYERRADAMRALMLNLMSVADQTKVTLPEATISMTKGRETVEVTDVDALPQGFYSLERKADKISILGALKAGEAIPGASLRTSDASLTVRAK